MGGGVSDKMDKEGRAEISDDDNGTILVAQLAARQEEE